MNTPKRTTRLAAMALALAFCGLAQAETAERYIRISTTSTVRSEGGNARVTCKITNTGTATADNLVLVIPANDGTASTNRLGHIDPNSEREATVQIATNAHTFAVDGCADCLSESPAIDPQAGLPALMRALKADETNSIPDCAIPGRYTTIARLAYDTPEKTRQEMAFAIPYTIGDCPQRHPFQLASSSAYDEAAGIARVTVTCIADRDADITLEAFHSMAIIGIGDGRIELKCANGAPATAGFAFSNVNARAGSVIPITIVAGSYFHASEPIEIGCGNATADRYWHSASITEMFAIPAETARAAPKRWPLSPWWILAPLALLVIAELFSRSRKNCSSPVFSLDVATECALLAFIAAFICYQMHIDLVFKDTLCIGGDTPAHHYLAKHLEGSLKQGRVVSWAGGWWCGFPMFIYYFPLPYIVIALLDIALPYNIAFKLGTMLGVLLLPFTAYFAARIMRLKRPAPIFLAVATIPLLFDTVHTMWGVNTYSTMAGMISNSYSFAIFPLAFSSALRDALDGKARIRTIAFLALVIASHFFTAIVLALLLGAVALIFGTRAILRKAEWRNFRALAIDGIAAVLIMAWWLGPLVMMRPWSVDFGDPWRIPFFKNLAPILQVSLYPSIAIALLFLALGCKHAEKEWRAYSAFMLSMLVAAIALFFFGSRISPVFVNCRMWPFITYSGLALLALCATAAVNCLARAKWAAALLFACAVFAFAWRCPNNSRDWSAYNYGGIEALDHGNDFMALAEAVKGTPGRLEYDLHDGNNALGSSRIFECMPAVAGKPIVEGGIVNSALGSIAAYSVQGEVSENCAGAPVGVTALAFDPFDGLPRLELYGVKHFIARSDSTKKALDISPEWRLLQTNSKWQLYENTKVSGTPIRAFNNRLPVVATTDVKRTMNAWMTNRLSYAQPWILKIAPTNSPLPEPPEADMFGLLPDLADYATPVEPTEWTDGRIAFTTDRVGKPHYIAVSYFPYWRVQGAESVEIASSGHIIVTPTQQEVTLTFRPPPINLFLKLLSILAILTMASAEAVFSLSSGKRLHRR